MNTNPNHQIRLLTQTISHSLFRVVQAVQVDQDVQDAQDVQEDLAS